MIEFAVSERYAHPTDQEIGGSMTFYETLERAMNIRGMRPCDVIERCNTITSSYLSRLKTGYIKDVTWSKALEIIAALDMTPDEFYELSVSND